MASVHSSGSKKIEIGALSLEAEKAKQQESLPVLATQNSAGELPQMREPTEEIMLR